MSSTYTLELTCHVRPGPDAILTIIIDGNAKEFTLSPTINWVASTTKENGNTVLVDLSLAPINAIFAKNKKDAKQEFCFEISAKNNDVLICGYSTVGFCGFNIIDQPVWNDPDWQPYLLSGHIGENAQFSGPGSLQVLEGQTVKFTGELNFYDPLKLSPQTVS